ncbi:hypothetical protein C7S13_3761 [Burkholderia cepacia]|nr:hypothetical protein [Burkholderia cepacia]
MIYHWCPVPAAVHRLAGTRDGALADAVCRRLATISTGCCRFAARSCAEA